MKLTTTQIKNRRQWADALMSSKKIKGQLRGNGSSRCCLGVMCEMFYPTKFAMTVDVSGHDYSLPEDINVFHQSVQRMFNMTPSEMYELADLNDGVYFDVTSSVKSELTHKEIGLYLYLTCEAGETPY